MAYFLSSLGGVSWICGGGEYNLSSFCLQRTIIDAINLLFFCVFCLFLLFGRKHDSIDTKRKDNVLVVASIFCSVTAIIYFSFGLYDFINHNGELDNSSLVPCIIRSLIWIFLAISLQFQSSKKWIIYLNSIWWVSLCALLSALNIEHLLKVHTIFVLDFVPWLVSFILLLSAFRNHGFFVSQKYDTKFDPLLFPETENVEIRTNGLSQANFLSKLTFSWINPLLSLGYKKPLSLENIPPLPSEDRAEVSYKKFAIALDSLLTERNSNSPSKNLVIMALIRVFWKENVYIAVNALARSVSASVSPLIIFAFVNYANREEDNLCEGLSILMCLVVAKLVECWCQRHWNFDARRSGMRIRSAAMVAVYHKLLKISSLGRRRHSNGEIVNYIAVDAYRFGEFLWWFHTGWSLALQVILGICVLYYVAGISALPGLVLLLMFGICNVPYANKIKNCQSQILFSQDQRLRSTSEILNNIKIIKLQSWEDKFKSLLESLRDSEFKWLAETQFTKALGTLLWIISPTIICVVVLLGCVFFGTASLDAATIFTVLATLRSMSEPVKLIPEALSVISQVKISGDRLNSFLLDHELKTDEKRSVLMIPDSDKFIEIEAGCFSWDEESLNLNLRDINLDIKKGQKVAVCGPVGAGKSSLLQAILGEMPKVSGTVNLYGRVAYVSQTSWIQSGTIRDNILFGKPIEGDRYENVIKSCALDKDINTFSHGDLTEIGQRGLNLSGGQKQRVQLARAVYNDADIYLLDDPFSAVDAHTAAILFHDCVMSALRDKTVILVTHQVEFLTEVDKILVMEGGCISQAGSHEELLTLGTTFEQLMNAHKDAITLFGAFHQNQENSHHQVPNGVNKTEEKNNSTREICEANFEEKQLTEEEQRESGSGGWKVFIDYIVISKGKMLLCYCLVSLIVFSLLSAASSYWLAIASDIPSISSVMLVGVYTILSLSSAIIVYIRSLFVAHLGLKASIAFFSGFTSAIFNAPMSFFDSTPVGRILTRASSDLNTMDVDMPFGLVYVAQSGCELLTGIAIMTSITWEVLILAILTLLVAKYLQGYYQGCARELVRINGTTKAPVMNYTTETSAGVVTVRAFKMMDTFFQTFLNLVDSDASLFLYTNAAMEWLLLRIELLQSLILFTTASFFVFLPKGSIAPGLVGLSLSYALSLTRSQIFFTQWYCQLSNFIISIERIKQFMEIPQEPPKIVEDKRPPSSWPFKGRIDFQDLKVRYRANGPLVLDGIRCSLREGTRVGVVGRTGSGKTTLVSALFRLVEPTSGLILIDGLNICSIGLKDLRLKLSIIPQDPVLFRGSVRTNLDPLHQFSDHQIWKVLEMCQLKEVISGLPYLLDSSVSDEGENWSVGQRQLFCLGRVLLRRNKIVVLDEATASIDSATDAILQRLIRDQFSECTVLTVAHRVPSVIHADMVMVLSYGKLVEYDEPSKLMEASSSSFAKLVAEYWSSCRRNTF